MEDDKLYDFIKRILIINLIMSILFSSIVFLFNVSLVGFLIVVIPIVVKLVLLCVLNSFVNQGDITDNVSLTIILCLFTIYFAIEAIIYNNFLPVSIYLIIPILIITLKKDSEIIKIESIVTAVFMMLTLILSIFVTPFKSNIITILVLSIFILLQLLIIIKKFTDETLLISAKSDFFMDKSKRDGMTGLYNNGAFYDEVAERTRLMAPFCIIIINIDNFKKVKDTFGQPFGDYVIKTLVQIIKKATRDQDIAFRYGGEDVAIIFPRTLKEESFKIAEKIRKIFSEKTFEHNVEWVKTKRPITISVGLIENTKRGAMPQELIEKCDHALFYSKQHGKNQTTIYHEHIVEWEDKFEDFRRKYRDFER